MHAPQIIVLVWFAFRVVASAAMHGKLLPKSAAVVNGMSVWVNVAIAAGILYWGGFWDPR